MGEGERERERRREGGGLGRKRGKEGEEMGACRGEERPGKISARFLVWVKREKTLEKPTGTVSRKPREGQVQRRQGQKYPATQTWGGG